MKVLKLLYFVLCFQLLLSFHFHVDSSILSTLSFNSSSPTKLCPRDQTLALIQFKNSLSIDRSVRFDWCLESNSKTDSWREGTDCCLWDGVKCESETGNVNVIGLDLTCSCLNGTIPSNSSLFLLHHLQHLNLAFNYFYPSQLEFKFGQFSKLTHLNISYSGFTGIIPPQISHLSKLLSLDLSGDSNDLIIEGHVFEKVLRNMTQLQHLLLDYVNMSSVLPTSFLNMSSYITTLSLGRNGLEGKLPVDVFRFPCLQKFKSDGNGDLIMNFPKSNWSSPLRSLEVSESFSRELPDSIGSLRSLQVLDLSFNHLRGSIPVTLGNLTRLNHLDLSHNSINGPILFSFSNFNQLSYLDLSQNNLLGPIPDSFENLTELGYLSMRNNSLSGHLPFSAFNLTQIETLEFSENEFVGSLPAHVSGLSRLLYLYLDSNFLTGKIPSWLFSLPSLLHLGLNDNNFTGPIEPFDKAGPVLERVDLSNNEIKGPIPSFSKLVNLIDLDLSSNKLKGIFVLDKTLNKLNYLNLSNNTFISLTSTGSSPNYSLPNLEWLCLASCNIIDFPDVVRNNLPSLAALDLSYNRILVIEAHMFSNLQGLVYLHLEHNTALSIRNNTFTNVSLVILPSLRQLSLSYCNITQFPNFLISLGNLARLDLSNNKMVGEILSWICNLYGMETLDLSNNNLSGNIPNIAQ